jgi:hypothetical protein
MNASQNVKSGCNIEQHIYSLQLSPDERNAALHAARVAEVFVDAIAWVYSKMERPDAGVYAKPSPKY